MRRLNRPRQPECLETNTARWTEAFVTSRQKNPKYRFSWPKPDCYLAVRKRLSEMTQAHCAFCDGQIGTESRETVEHFRPKSRFPGFAYVWDNLFPCCDMCQSQKREQFDDGLLKPDDDDFAFMRYFVVNFKTGEIEPSPYADEQLQDRAKITIRIYGLNLPARNNARRREWERFCRDQEPFLDDYNYRFFLDDNQV